jgi:hypothetical protein
MPTGDARVDPESLRGLIATGVLWGPMTNKDPLVQLCRDQIAAHRATLDNFDTFLTNWTGGNDTSSIGGGRGMATTPRTQTRNRTRSRSGGGRGHKPQALGAQTSSR